MTTFRIRVIACLMFFASWLCGRSALWDAQPLFLAGAYAIDITPTSFPVNIIGGFLQKKTDRVVDPLHARALVLDDGAVLLLLELESRAGWVSLT